MCQSIPCSGGPNCRADPTLACVLEQLWPVVCVQTSSLETAMRLGEEAAVRVSKEFPDPVKL